MTDIYTTFSQVEGVVNTLKQGGLLLPATEELTLGYVSEIIAFATYIGNIPQLRVNVQHKVTLPNDEAYGTGLWESTHIQHLFELAGETVPTILCEPVPMTEVLACIGDKVKLSCSLTLANADLLINYATLLGVREETAQLYAKRYPEQPSPYDNDYLGSAHQLLSLLVRTQSRDYTQLPSVQYNEVTGCLELTYRIPEHQVLALMRTGLD